MEDICFEFAIYNIKSGVLHFLYDKISSSTFYSLSVVVNYYHYIIRGTYDKNSCTPFPLYYLALFQMYIIIIIFRYGSCIT